MAAIIIRDRMPPLLDARGLARPLPAVKARAALAALAPGETLVVLATDPEAPVDIGALAAGGGHTFTAAGAGGGGGPPVPRRARGCGGADHARQRGEPAVPRRLMRSLLYRYSLDRYRKAPPDGHHRPRHLRHHRPPPFAGALRPAPCARAARPPVAHPR